MVSRFEALLMTKTQKTPKGYEIPVPTHGDVFNVLKKAAQPLPRKSGPKK
jgi:hypothetical protein